MEGVSMMWLVLKNSFLIDRNNIGMNWSICSSCFSYFKGDLVVFSRG